MFDCFKMKIASSSIFPSCSSLKSSWAAIVYWWRAHSYHTQVNKKFFLPEDECKNIEVAAMINPSHDVDQLLCGLHATYTLMCPRIWTNP